MHSYCLLQEVTPAPCWQLVVICACQEAVVFSAPQQTGVWQHCHAPPTSSHCFRAREGPFLQCESPAGLSPREHTRAPAQLAPCLCSCVFPVLSRFHLVNLSHPRGSPGFPGAERCKCSTTGEGQCLMAWGPCGSSNRL